ncbi:enoyl-CoA hydratase-related protein [Spongiactinospora sp. TRM90649]|uniref:enoyl-CoA hydratase/isomerase family protein n=1 Tax=Spongiactinospora sp. TRM90649 TaxID=3031114 RepID=UPI0023F8B1F1|nr:enoyl-CoA hydratase-related protein [Spongiactinospora sp. TRM90649]MDF5753442.1 enoyl-CoA hydratase-related protein [Spongiactinospora sp. TRM90649]
MTAEATSSAVRSPVIVTRNGATATLTLNRPSRKNAIDDQGWRLLGDALESLATDDAVRVVIVTGAEGNFCAGADLGSQPRDEHPVSRMRRVGNIAIALSELPKPVIAKVEGVAAGAGWNLALACDFVVASTSARFSQIFARRGLSIDFGGSWLLPRLVGLQQAKRLAMLAEMISAGEAQELGLVTWVRPEDELAGFVTELALRLAALPPVALAQSKALLQQGTTQTLREAIDNESRAQAVNLATEDAPAAFRAFLEKAEPPAYTGRWALR